MGATGYERIRVQTADGVATLIVDRPEARNAIDRRTTEELERALANLEGDEGIGVVILTGGGEKVFVSGADIRDLKERTRFDALEARNSRLFRRIQVLEKPTIAAVNGYALGGGCELALACDLRIASTRARFGFPEVGLGIIPSAGGTQRLPRLIGLSRATELILTGRIIEAEEALRIGLVSRIAKPGELLPAASELAGQLLKRGPLALRLAKQALRAALDLPLDAGLDYESALQATLFESEDKLEGMTAFLEKREPRFRGK